MRGILYASVRPGPPDKSPAARALLLDAAVDHLLVRKDFQAAFDTCEKGLESSANSDEPEETWWVN